MTGPRFALQPCDEEFFDAAPVRFRHALELPVSAQRLWRELTSDTPLSWCRLLTSVRWTSPRPYGVGTTRTARVTYGLPSLDERFFRWEEGRRKSFYVLESNLPMFHRFAEDYLVEEVSPTTCRFTWTIAAEPRAAMRPGAPVLGLMVRSLIHDTRRHFRRLASIA